MFPPPPHFTDLNSHHQSSTCWITITLKPQLYRCVSVSAIMMWTMRSIRTSVTEAIFLFSCPKVPINTITWWLDRTEQREMQQELLLMQTLHIHNYGSSFWKLLKPSRVNTQMLSETFWQSHHIEHLDASLTHT